MLHKILFFLLLLGSLFAQPPEASLKAIENAMLHFYLDQADSLALELEDEGYKAFYQSNILLYRYLAAQNARHLEAYREGWKPAVEQIEVMPNRDPLKKTMLAEMYGKRAALEFLDGKQLKAVNLVRNCRKLIQENVRRFPEDQSQNKLLGLFNVVFAAVPKKFQWLTNLLGYKGDMDLGMRQLAAAGYYGKLLPLEAELIAYYVEKNSLSRPDLAIRRMEIVRKRKGSTILTDFLLASAYGTEKKGSRALEILNNKKRYQSNKQVFFIPFWEYVRGKELYYKEDYPLAKAAFRQFLERHQGNIYRLDASFRLGMTEVFLGENESAGKRFQSLLTMQASPFDEDDYALALAGQFARALPDTTLQMLFRARNRFDGGYYNEALRILETLKPESLDGPEKTEWYYRKGRILHARNLPDRALEMYTKAVVQTASGNARWMQAYASFYMGEIAREQGDEGKATAYYRTAMSFDAYYYQAGLENRVKAALAKMKK
jgi:tetratricopeptide (TPR) repeat protein